MTEVPSFLWLSMAAGVLAVGVFGLRGLLEIHDALRLAELDRLSSLPQWKSTRALCGVLPALPLVWVARDLGIAALLGGLVVTAIGFCAAPGLLAGLKRRVEQQLLDDLGVHLDLLAVAMEAGSSWSAALALCIERLPEGPLRRAWPRVLFDIHAGGEPLDCLRAMEQRLRLQPLATLVSALRAAEKLQLPAAMVLRDRARHCAAGRFARAERRARAAPLKLYAALLLCLAPCTALVLAFPLSRYLGKLLD